MARTEVRCLCGHANHYEVESPGSRYYVCTDEPGVKRFTLASNVVYINGYSMWICPICGTMKGVRLTLK